MKLDVFVEGKRKVVLNDTHFIGEGGEGRVFGYGSAIFKIYNDPAKTIPQGKIAELQVLDHPNILRPRQLLCDRAGRPVGFTMDWVKNTVPLCRLFTGEFRARAGVSDGATVTLVEALATTIRFIHRHHCLIVDGNEMNYLVDGTTFTLPYFIDVDSYQTPGFPATAVMDSIRDYRSPGFSEGSDWFAFAVVATQLFLGIHPFKGTHPAYGKAELKRRMQDGVSIFDKDVRLPATVRQDSVIPARFRDWLRRVFEHGERSAPPAVTGSVVTVTARPVAKTSDRFILTLLHEFPDRIDRIQDGYILSGGSLYEGPGKPCATTGIATDLVRTSSGTPVLVTLDDDGTPALRLIDGTPLAIPLSVRATGKMVTENTLYLVCGGTVVEVEFLELNSRIIPGLSPTGRWQILPLATQLFDGVLYQNILGTPWLSIFYHTATGRPAAMVRHFPELAGYRLVEGKHDNRVAILIGERHGRYDAFLFRFAADYATYRLAVEEDVPYHIPNFVALDNGVVIRITLDDEIQAFHRDPAKDAVTTVIREPGITADMRLHKGKHGVMLAHGNKLYSFRSSP